jgi:3-hydroxybutyrate dehydrogenase
MNGKELAKLMMSRMPSGNPVQVEEVAYIALFLASDMARSITGVSFPIDGGATAA